MIQDTYCVGMAHTLGVTLYLYTHDNQVCFTTHLHKARFFQHEQDARDLAESAKPPALFPKGTWRVLRIEMNIAGVN